MSASASKETVLHDLRLTTLAAQSTYNESQFALETLLNHVQPAYANRVDALLRIDGLSALLREKEALLESLADEGRARDERLKRVEREFERERKGREEERTKQSSAKEKESLKAIEALQAENATLKTTIGSLENKLGQLNKSHDDLSRDMERLESRYASEKDVTAEQEKISKYWQSLHDEAAAETKRLRDEMKTLQKEIDDEKQTRRKVEKELMVKDEEFRKYRKEHDLAVEESNAAEIEALREELAGVRQLSKESEKRIGELTQKNKKMEQDNKGLNAELRDTQKKLHGTTLASKDLERTNEQLMSQLDREKQMYSQLVDSMAEERRNMKTDDYMKTPRAAPAKKASGRGNAKATEPGEKSLFSTTPFLNKTVLLEDEEEESEEGDEERLLGKKKKLPSRLQLQEEEYAEEPKKKRQPTTKKKGAATTKTTAAAGRGKKRASPSLDLNLDGEDEDIMPTKAGRKKETTTLSGIPLLPPPTMRPTEPKKKKLLSQNRSILEDDDDDDDEGQRGGGLLGAFGGPKRAIKKTVRGGGAGGASRGGILADFGAISPRKRSR